MLQRDVEQEKARLQAEAEAATAAAAAVVAREEQERAASTIALDKKQLDVSVPSENTAQPSTETEILTEPSGASATQGSPMLPGPANGSLPPGRRPSTISLSSLNRPQFPHKLDLSSTALRINPEDIVQGLASPVTLAPKSGRLTATSEFPPDFLAAFTAAKATSSSGRPVEIDLTALPDSEHSVVPPNLGIDPALGSSADRPIELDLDGMDIDVSNMGHLFASPSTGTNTSAVKTKEGGMGIEIDSSPAAPSNSGGDLLSSFEQHPELNHGQFASSSQGSSSQTSRALDAPSHDALIVSLDSGGSSATQLNHSFDIGSLDLSNFSAMDSGFGFDSAPGNDMSMLDMEALLNMGGEASGNTQNNTSGT